jgi:hypothetical protein
MSLAILPVVEGQSESESVPVLLRRILDRKQAYRIQVARPFRVKRNRVVKLGELERAVNQGLRDRERVGGVLVLLDSDDDCPALLGPKLLRRCRKATNLPVVVVLANREIEAWFLGAKESLRGVRGIRNDAVGHAAPETVRGAKEHLSKNMAGGRRYLEVDDQPALMENMELELASQRCPSFYKFLRDFEGLIDQLARTSR